eukprot:CAMPEP_0183450748 /NCGR_PEP_ID=MMETSP0370-20130417/113354_1 /TAXON_ID=268820 /ORGANISM="Peridinium aciculiferum, Strain PAER-2" /LENGTH=52 /DNA_ID=CAMNT_0025641911 /DNA_START=34 /DNA_END=192 /DNA_ORIENTATION=-
MAVLSRRDAEAEKRRPPNAGADKQELLDEVLGVLERGGGRRAPGPVSVGGEG